MEKAIKQMKQLGANIIDPANIETIEKFGETEYEVLLYEFKTDLNHYLKRRGNLELKTLKDIIQFNKNHEDTTMPYFGQDILILSEQKGPLSEKKYLDALKKNHILSRDKGLDALFKKHKLDAIIAPTGGPAWVTDHVNGDHFSGSSSSIAAVSGYPNITVPAGFIHGLPVGISFIGLAYEEGKLIQYAYDYEQNSKIRKPPKFLKTIKP